MKALFGLFYDILTLLGLLLLSPKMIRKWYKGGNIPQPTLSERLGIGIKPVEKGTRRLIWIHAVSLGETKAVAPLVAQLYETLDHPIVVVSSITATGHAEAKKAMPFAERHLYLPLDFSWVMRRLIRQITPDLVVITETDYWYHFLSTAKRKGAALVVVNGKLSERSTKRYLWFKGLARLIFGLFDALCVQSDEYRQRFTSIGVDPNKITVTGNLKFDATMSKLTSSELVAWRTKLGVKEDDFVVTAASTHDPEEKLILEQCRRLWSHYPNLKVIVIPRHPERFDAVAELLQREQISFVRFSSGSADPKSKVILVDAMGVVKECYQISHVAIVAGSFTQRVGGHNILEPCHYGLPPIFGPYMHSQPELHRLVLEAHAGLQVQPDQLAETIQRLFDAPALRDRYALAAKKLITANQGAVQRTLNVCADQSSRWGLRTSSK